ncbi:MAG: hypothetical protein D6775_09740 [Caldilineae bacterium]|nr:MAG: hypothetical protein D6775_09740 [Caldilineae bacterium]
MWRAAQAAVAGLEGTVLAENAGRGTLEAKFPKRIHGKVLGDRTHLLVQLSQDTEAATEVLAEVYPLDAIGRKLMFGARKGVPQTVMNWFFAHLEHHLSSG